MGEENSLMGAGRYGRSEGGIQDMDGDKEGSQQAVEDNMGRADKDKYMSFAALALSMMLEQLQRSLAALKAVFLLEVRQQEVYQERPLVSR
jgi:hypothetical protein